MYEQACASAVRGHVYYWHLPSMASVESATSVTHLTSTRGSVLAKLSPASIHLSENTVRLRAVILRDNNSRISIL